MEPSASQQITGLGLESEGFGRRVKFSPALARLTSSSALLRASAAAFFAFSVSVMILSRTSSRSGLVRPAERFSGKERRTRGPFE